MNKGMWFLLGAGTGAFLTWLLMRKQYSEYEILEEYEPSFQNEEKEEEKPTIEKAFSLNEKPPLVNYSNKLKETGYISEERKPKNIYVIKPSEFGDIDDYERYTLTYYADGVLTDETDEVVDDVENAVGADFAEHFGEYEEDSVYVRNDIRSCDYEILADLRTYEEMLETKPKPVEVK